MAWRGRLDEIRSDAILAVRQMRRSPGFALAAVLTLALGSGATTAMYSVLDAVVLRPIPVPDPGTIVRMYETNPNSNAWTTSDPNYLDYRERCASFDAFGAITGRSMSLTGRGDPVLLNGSAASASYFGIFGDAPLLGSVYRAEQDRVGGDMHVVVLGERTWRTTFGADASIVGSTIVLDGAGYRVLGVMPAGYGYLPSDFWVPLAPDPAANRGSHLLVAFGRLKPGVTLAAAQREITTVAAELARRYPKSNGAWGARLEGFGDFIVGQVLRNRILLLFGTVGMVLLLACANVANLLLVRATAREKEIAVRAALGAGRGRLLRQLLTESLVLSLVGGAGGVAFASASMPAIRAASPFGIARIDEVALDGRVLAFALGAAILTGLLFGLAPALRAARREIESSLHGSSRAVAGTGRRTRDLLVVSELALATLLLIGAGLLGRSFLRMQAVDMGFRPDHVLQLTVTAPNDMPRERRFDFFDAIEKALAAVPGVDSIGASSIQPFTGANTRTQFLAEGHDAPDEFFAADWRSATPGLFATLGLRLMRGRLLAPADVAGQVPVAVVDETMARWLWPGQDPIGRHVMAAQSARTAADNFEVVGVVSDVRDQSPSADPVPAVYFSEAQKPWVQLTYFVRTSASASALAGGVRRAFREAAPGTPVPELVPLAQTIDGALAPDRFTSLLLAAFAAMALTIASVGLYGVVAHTVALRTRELGVRMALGASPSRIARRVVRDACALAAAGIAIGSVSALLLGRVAAGLLFGVAPSDATTYATVAAALFMVAIVASLSPALRAASVDPAVALRAE